MLQAGLARLGQMILGAGGISAELQHCRSPGWASSDLLSQTCTLVLPTLTERESIWDGPHSVKVQALLKQPWKLVFLLPATIPPFL